MRLIVCLLSFMCLTVLAVESDDDSVEELEKRGVAATPGAARHSLPRVRSSHDLSAMRAPVGEEADDEASDGERETRSISVTVENVGVAASRQLQRRHASLDIYTGVRPADDIAQRPESTPVKRRSRLDGVSDGCSDAAFGGMVEVVVPMSRKELLERSDRAKKSANAVLAEAQRRAAAALAERLKRVAAAEEARQHVAAVPAHAAFFGDNEEEESDHDHSDMEDPEVQRALAASRRDWQI
ncbi:MAG: hypothetical protein CMM87_00355 [Rickettsiales bacterium]|nr:hypothetical protein [Rickettsiales bacterium]|tara:strand:- start:187 stop:909 length:723 start_codon:yes stop_codon:yes gene_type:complete